MSDYTTPDMPERSRETGAPALKRLKISPRAMALAAKNGADISKAVPTGPMGRIIERDIERLLAEKTGAVFEADSIKPEPAAQCEASHADEPLTTDNIPAEEKATPESEELHPAEPVRSGGYITLSAAFDASELLDLEKRLAEHGGELGLPQITAADMIAFAAAKILSATEYGEIAVRLRVYSERSLRERYIPDARGLSLGAFAKISENYTGGNKSCLIDVSYFGELGIESFSPDPELLPEHERIFALTVGCVTNRVMADGRVYPSITLTLGAGGAELYRAAEYLDRLCRGLCQLGLTLII